MSWIQKLYETYDACKGNIGDVNDEVFLLPIAHTTQNAQIQIVIDEQGNFLKASTVSKEDIQTIIPCTEKSAGRTSGLSPHPLSDKLQYIAKDYIEYGGDKKPAFDLFNELLSNWVKSDFANVYVKAVYNYLLKGKVIHDLIAEKILITGKDGKLIKKWNGANKDTPQIFSLMTNNSWQADAFIRWEVNIPGDVNSKLWLNKSVWQSWLLFYKSIKKDISLCYITGMETPNAEILPDKIRHSGDDAKLISSNDKSGFTYRGRFIDAEQTFSVSFEASQKAHNALRWLIGKQGFRNGDQVFVAWSVSGSMIPDPFANSLNLFFEEEIHSEISSVVSTAQVFANNLNKLMAGYSVKLGSSNGVSIIGLDSASPGRLAVIFYRELTGSEFLERIKDWHLSSAWLQNYGFNSKSNQFIQFIGAPSPKDIALTMFGMMEEGKGKSKIVKATIERILPCLLDGNKIPLDIVQSCVRRVSNRISFEENWQWDKALGITCSIFKNFYRERGYKMSLEKDRNTRDYLYGRLLAIADRIEGLALYKAGEKRETSAARLMQRFSEQPFETWKNIELSLSPYKARLGGANFFQNQIDEIMGLFNSNDYLNNNRLSGEFLLGYHCQRKELNTYKVDDSNTDDAQVSENSNS